MRIACCFYGHVGGKGGRDGAGGWLDPLASLKNYAETLFSHSEVDYFVHSWSCEHENKINDFLTPVYSIFEPQKDFSCVDLDNYSLSMINDYAGIVKSQKDPAHYLTELAKRARSRWLSSSTVLDLCDNHCISKGVTYDIVVLLRLDLYFYKLMCFTYPERETLYTSQRMKDIDTTVEDLILYGEPHVILGLRDIHKNHARYSIRPPSAIYQYIKKNRFHVNDAIQRGTDFDLIRESSVNPSLTKYQILRKKIKLLIR